MKLDKILIATTNKGKHRELKKMLEPLGIEVLSLADMPEKPEIVEDGKTFLENAIKKAEGYGKYFKMPVVADDSGLVIEALDGYPGVYSSRFYDIDFGGKEKFIESADKTNVKKVLRLLKDEKNRNAKFVSYVVFYINGDIGLISVGEVKGKITDEPRGEGGFGYDPIFIPEGYDKTFAEMSLEEKNKLSHRGRAFKKLVNMLEKLIQKD
jgi:XTP/dITP diphosphohydrolase